MGCENVRLFENLATERCQVVCHRAGTENSSPNGGPLDPVLIAGYKPERVGIIDISRLQQVISPQTGVKYRVIKKPVTDVAQPVVAVPQIDGVGRKGSIARDGTVDDLFGFSEIAGGKH